jgi:DNA-binding IclR family transcriptional regulator
MKTTRQSYRPIDPKSVEIYWAWGLDTYEIALRTGSRESEVYKHLGALLDRKWVERKLDQDRFTVSPQC